MSPWWACLRNSEEANESGAEHPQRRAGGGEIKEAGRGPGMYGLIDRAKDFRFHSNVMESLWKALKAK